ncbi:MAG TPA: hypothetical protein VN843_01580 [Anaerolineales bacterium]|nr:hypothetical protein [Anaerolineales bacterium]
MYALHRLTKDSQDFVFSFTGTANGRKDSTSLAIAAVLVNSICFIKNPEENLLVGEGEKRIIHVLNDINEMIRIDPDSIMGYVRKLYQYRRSLLVPLESPHVVYDKPSAVLDFFGITKYFTKEDLFTITDEGVKISFLQLKFQFLFRELGCLETLYPNPPS